MCFVALAILSASFCQAYIKNPDCVGALPSAGIAGRGISWRSSGAASPVRHGSSMEAREGENGEDQACPMGWPVA
jgi:hypothetical protein